MGIKKSIKTFISAALGSIFKEPKIKMGKKSESEMWSGNYSSWSEARNRTSGYDSATILDKCKTALLKVKNGEAVYERDSVLFNELEYSWGLLAGLQRAALENRGKLCVMDFGGSLGSTYYQNKNFLRGLDDLQWCIVEQSNFVDCGKKYFENEHLEFYYTVDECMSKHKPNVLLLSSVMQYLEKPYEWIAKFVALKIPYIVIDRTAFVDSERNILTVQNVPEEIYRASYPCWFFNEKKMLAKFDNYSILGSFESFCDVPLLINSTHHGKWRGHILRLNK